MIFKRTDFLNIFNVDKPGMVKKIKPNRAYLTRIKIYQYKLEMNLIIIRMVYIFLYQLFGTKSEFYEPSQINLIHQKSIYLIKYIKNTFINPQY